MSGPEITLREIIDGRFLLTHSIVDQDVWTFEFGIGNDAPAHVDLGTLAFRCDQTPGVSLTILSTMIPRFMDRKLDYFERIRYRMEVNAEVAPQLATILLQDMDEADDEVELFLECELEKVETSLMGRIFELMGAAVSDAFIAMAAFIAALVFWGRWHDTAVFWVAVPAIILFSFRTARLVAQLLSTSKQYKRVVDSGIDGVYERIGNVAVERGQDA